MPRFELTYGQLLALRDDIIRQQQTSAAFFYFNKSRVEKFFNQNQMALKVLKSRMDEYVKKYVKFDADAQPITEEKDGTLVYTFYSEESKEQYKKALNNFMALKISIEL